MKLGPIAMTGAQGFLGWHTRCAAHARGLTVNAIPVGESFQRAGAAKLMDGADRLIHLAGVNRGSDEDVRAGNIVFASQIADAIVEAERPPRVIVFANSVQAGNGTPYGEAKLQAAESLRAAAGRVGAEFTDVRLPNVFGEHGRPFYNSVVATFCRQLADHQEPRVDRDAELGLLHAQTAADMMLGFTEPRTMDSHMTRATVTDLLGRLQSISAGYAAGDIPDIASPFSRDLFNTYRSFLFDARPSNELAKKADERGAFFECVRSHGGGGQSSFSTTVSGVSRGDHYHLRKVERFTVIAGEGTIRLRKLFTDRVLEIPVSGAAPMAIDMPTMWAHKIVNTGTAPLYTLFWSNEIFDPGSPDTYAEAV